MMVLLYPTKKELIAAVGQPLKYQETSLFGDEYRFNGTFCGNNRPQLTGFKREFSAEVTMQDGKITKIK